MINFELSENNFRNNEKKKKFFIKAAISFVAGLVITFVVMMIENIFDGEDIVLKLCDGFLAGGVSIVCIAALKAIGRRGEYDGLSYIGYNLNPLKRVRYQNYSEFKERKEREREKKPPSGHKAMFLGGGVLIFISLIFLVIYYI